MALKLPDGKFACSICGTKYPQAIKADGCRDSHQLLYIPMSKSELNKLMHAIVMDDFSLVPPHLLQTLQKYARFQVTQDVPNGSPKEMSDM